MRIFVFLWNFDVTLNQTWPQTPNKFKHSIHRICKSQAKCLLLCYLFRLLVIVCLFLPPTPWHPARLPLNFKLSLSRSLSLVIRKLMCITFICAYESSSIICAFAICVPYSHELSLYAHIIVWLLCRRKARASSSADLIMPFSEKWNLAHTNWLIKEGIFFQSNKREYIFFF